MEPAVNDPGQARLSPELNQVRLDMLVGSDRFAELDKYEAYFRCKQYENRQYDWDGRIISVGESDIAPRWDIPLKSRRPRARYELAKLIVKRFTAMVFSGERFPAVVVPGDPDCEDFCKALSQASGLQSKLNEARDLGGAEGTVGMSFCFIDGAPRVRVHNGKHLNVLRWADREQCVVGSVLEVYAYPKRVWGTDGKPKTVKYYFARYWDEQTETVWDPIPEAHARTTLWSTLIASKTVAHGFGFTPLYWVQNLPESVDEDGESDYDGQFDDFDSINEILSGLVKGTVANLDPTLVIKSDPASNTGTIKKGSGNAIYASNGAEYLEISGEAIRAGLELAIGIEKRVLDAVACIVGDPAELASRAQSAAAMRMLYLPMLTQADRLRSQYGKLMLDVLKGMLRVARVILSTPPGPVLVTSDGRRVQAQPSIKLPQRVVTNDNAETGETTVIYEDRKPGTSENLELNWPPYFPNTWVDIKSATEAIMQAAGGKQIISRKTAITNAAAMYGVGDVEEELATIEEEEEAATQRMLDLGAELEDDDDDPDGDDKDKQGGTGKFGTSKEPKEKA